MTKPLWYTIITKLDFIGRQPTMKLSGAPRNQTIFGGILCFLIYALFIISAFYFGQELIYRDIPTVIETTQLVDSEDQIVLNNTNFNFFISMRSSINGDFLNIDDYLNIEITLINKTSSGKVLNSLNIGIRDCYDSDFKVKNGDKTFNTINPSNYKCIDTARTIISIKSTEISNSYSYLSLSVSIKDNSQESQEIISNSVIYLKSVDTSFNMREFNDYGVPTLFTQAFSLNEYRPQNFRIHLQLITYKTDIGYMFEDFKVKTFHKIIYTDTFSLPKSVQNILMQIDIVLNSHKQVNYRKYYKFQNWVAELGGIVRAITLVAFVLNYYNDQSIYYEKMINNLFDVDDIIKYFQYSTADQINHQTNKGPRDSIVLCSAKKEKTFFEKEYQQLYNCNSEIPINNFLINPLTKRPGMTKTSLNEQRSNLKASSVKRKSILSETSEEDPHEIYINSLRKNKVVKEHFEKVKKSRFRLSPIEVFVFCFCKKKDNPKYNSFIGGRELIRERGDIIYILRKNLQFDRFKNLILRDYQVLLLNSLTKFMLDPERVNLSTFESCHYDKFLDAYDNVTCGNNIIDMKLSKWVETKFKFENKV